MFHPIDFENWDRKEIFTCFEGYLYCMTVELDITEFLRTLREHQWKFYPAICYCIAKTVNENIHYRYGRVNWQVGYWDKLQTHYTVMRTHSNHLFTHQRTLFQEDFPLFCQQFLEDKEKAESGSSLYFDKSGAMDNVHISIMPNTSYTALSYSKPASFTKYDTGNTSYVPFVMAGKYRPEGDRMKLPVTVEFHHAVNDGYHAELFFKLLEDCCRTFG